MIENGNLKIFGGTANSALTDSICEFINIPRGDISIKRFMDGEIYVAFEENVRGTDCFLIQSTCDPVNSSLMELLVMIDAAKRASASRVTAVLPYYGYGRQDRKHRPRVAITAKLVANLLTTAGADRVLTMDLHAGQIQGFFDIPLDNLYASAVIIEEVRNLNLKNLTVVSPDLGSVKRARATARFLEAPLAIIDKRRPRENEAEVMNIIGDVEGQTVLVVDDMIDTAGTICQAAKALQNSGAKDVYCSATHAVLSGEAIARLQESPFKKLFVTDTIPLPENKKIDEIQVVTVGHLLAEAIDRIHHESTVSSLFLLKEEY